MNNSNTFILAVIATCFVAWCYHNPKYTPKPSAEPQQVANVYSPQEQQPTQPAMPVNARAIADAPLPQSQPTSIDAQDFQKQVDASNPLAPPKSPNRHSMDDLNNDVNSKGL